jgi:hypothetical protein
MGKSDEHASTAIGATGKESEGEKVDEVKPEDSQYSFTKTIVPLRRHVDEIPVVRSLPHPFGYKFIELAIKALIDVALQEHPDIAIMLTVYENWAHSAVCYPENEKCVYTLTGEGLEDQARPLFQCKLGGLEGILIMMFPNPAPICWEMAWAIASAGGEAVYWETETAPILDYFWLYDAVRWEMEVPQFRIGYRVLDKWNLRALLLNGVPGRGPHDAPAHGAIFHSGPLHDDVRFPPG